MSLNEYDYKLLLIELLQTEQPDVEFVSEYPFCFLRRRADLLLVEPECTHAIEIKSDVDNVYTLSEQLLDYRKCFNKVSVLISSKHKHVLTELDKNIGVFILENDVVKRYRQARMMKRLDKRIALDLLPTSTLQSLAGEKTPRVQSISKLSETLTYDTVNQLAYKAVKTKVSPVFSLFKLEKGSVLSKHDLSVLAMRSATL